MASFHESQCFVKVVTLLKLSDFGTDFSHRVNALLIRVNTVRNIECNNLHLSGMSQFHFINYFPVKTF